MGEEGRVGLGRAEPFLGLLHPTHRQQRDRRVPGEQVADADAVVGEQPTPVADSGLDQRRIRRVVGHHQVARLLLVPAEGGDVVVVAMKDAGLADRRRRWQRRHPRVHSVRTRPQPPADGGNVSSLHVPAEDRLRHSVELQEEHPRFFELLRRHVAHAHPGRVYQQVVLRVGGEDPRQG